MTEQPDSIHEFLKNRAAVARSVSTADGRSIPAGTIGSVKSDGSALRFMADDGRIAVVAKGDVLPLQSNGDLPGCGEAAVSFCAVVGSRSQGLTVEGSDTDRRGFYIPGASVHFSLNGAPEQLVHDDEQMCFWEVEKFVRLALAANPTVLETLYSPIVEFISPRIASAVSDLRDGHVFLSSRVAETFRGYADSQFEKMTRHRARGGDVKWSHAMHMIRLLDMGTRVMATGTLNVEVSPEQREEFLAIKRGDIDWHDLLRRRDRMIEEFRKASDGSSLPRHPDVDAAEKFLVNVRMAVVEEAR